MEKGVAVEKPLIQLVVDLRTGVTYPSRALIERERRLVNRMRLWLKDRIKRDKPWLACPWCGVAVYLVQSAERRWFFRHIHEQDELCPHKTRGDLNHAQILAAKFNGQKEGRRHKEIKRRIVLTLSSDSSFSSIAEERRWIGALAWRRPDVQAAWNHPTAGEIRIALEAQLSTTFIDVIAERRSFYRSEGGVLMWIFPGFESAYSRQFADDIRDNNNSNVFVIDDETVARSESEGKAYVRCHYAMPRLSLGRDVEDEWKSEIVPFDALKVNRGRQQVYFHDYAQQRAGIEGLRDVLADATLRKLFETFVRTYGNITYEDRIAFYARLTESFKQRGIELPKKRGSEFDLVQTGRILFGAKNAEVVGLRFKNLIEVAHHADSYEQGRRCLRPFGWLMKHHKTEPSFAEGDGSGAWEARREKIRKAMEAGDEQYDLDPELVPVIRFLFPEIQDKIDQSFALQMQRQRERSARSAGPTNLSRRGPLGWITQRRRPRL